MGTISEATRHGCGHFKPFLKFSQHKWEDCQWLRFEESTLFMLVLNASESFWCGRVSALSCYFWVEYSGIKGRLEFLNFVKPFTNDSALPHFLVEVIGYQACAIKVQMYWSLGSALCFIHFKLVDSRRSSMPCIRRWFGMTVSNDQWLHVTTVDKFIFTGVQTTRQIYLFKL